MDPGSAGIVDGTPLDTAQAGARLGDLARAPLGSTADASFRISLAGAKKKIALLFK